MKNRRRTICEKYCLFKHASQIIDGTVPFELTKEVKHATRITLKTRNNFLTQDGIDFKVRVLAIKSLYQELKPKTIPKNPKSDLLPTKFINFYKNHGEMFRKTLTCNLLEYIMKVMEGNVNAKCGERIMDFYMMIRTSSGQAARYVAANLPGPGIRSLCCHCARADLLQNGGQQTIINKSTQQMVNDICHRVRAHFTKEQKIAFSLSIDATANASMLLVDKTQMVLVGGTPPHHSIPIPEEYRGERLSEFLDKEMKEFEKIDTGRTLATKVKLATISFQKNGQESPLLQLAARPQTKNEASNFNYKIVDACLQDESDLCRDGWDISFTFITSFWALK